MKTSLFIITIFLTSIVYGQQEELKFKNHSNLVGSTWETNGKWTNGADLKLKVSFTYSLSNTIIKSKTHGNISKNLEEYIHGLRSEGVLQYDSDGNLKFWEFDVFSNVTTGVVKYFDKNIFYSYSYQTANGEQTITDGWEYIDDKKYKYRIGEYNFSTNQWDKIYLESYMTKVEE